MTEKKLTSGELIKKYWKLLMETLKYSLTGILNTAIDAGVYTLLASPGLITRVFSGYTSPPVEVMKTIAYCCGIINSFFLNKFWSFRKKKEQNALKGMEILKFVFVNLVALGFSILGIKLIGSALDIDTRLANLMVFPIPFIINFFLYKFWIFKNNSLTSEEEADSTGEE